MIRLEQTLLRLENDLRQLALRWAMIGGVAVSLRAEPRTTRDLDVAVAVETDREAERIVRELWSRGYRLQSSPLEHLDAARMATVRFHAPMVEEKRRVVVDLLFASSGIEPEVVAGGPCWSST